MTITEQKFELLNINCMLLNIATIRQPYAGAHASYMLCSTHEEKHLTFMYN